MLDIKYIRKNVKTVKKAIRDKNETCDIDEILRLDKERRSIIKKRDKLREEVKYHQRKMTEMLRQLTTKQRKKVLRNARRRIK